MSKKQIVEKMIRQEKIKIKRKQVAKLFKSKCLICDKKFGKSFHFHHIKYYEDEKKYSDFKQHSSSQMNWMDYQDYILPIIEKRPEGFALLCNSHHRFVEFLIKFKLERLVKIVTLAFVTKGHGVKIDID